MESSTLLQTNSDNVTDDIVSFVVQDGAQTLCFSKRRLMQYTPFFKTYFAAHAAAADDGNTVVLKHVTTAAAEAALRLCHSRHHSDDGLFWALLRTCSEAPKAGQHRGALRDILSLYETCVKFELRGHARRVAGTVAAAVTTASVLDVLRTCARYTSALPSAVRAEIGLRAVLAACRPYIPAAWPCERDERRWRRLCSTYPELPAMVTAAALTVDDDAHITTATDGGGVRRGVPALLLSPQRDETGALSTTVEPQAAPSNSHAVAATAPTTLEDVFAQHLRQTEALALAAQRRRRAVEADVRALRVGGAALRARVREDEAAAAASTQFLGDARVYVQALRAAELDVHALSAALPADSASAAATLYAFRHELERAAELAMEWRESVDAQLVIEGDALRRLDDELAELRSEVC